MPVIKTEFACPKCKRETGQSTQIVAAEGRLSCPANSNHKWQDTAAFYADGPQMEFKVGPAVFPPVEGQTPITLKIPIRIKEALDTRYGDGLSAQAATVLLALSEGEVMIIGKTDLDRLRDRLGKTPENSSDLVGMVYAMICQVDEAKSATEEAVKDLKAYEGISRGRVVVDLGEHYESAVAKARDSEPPLPVGAWVQLNVRNAIENNWF